MFWRMVIGSLKHQNRKMLLVAFTVALGVSLATAMLNVLLGVGDKVNAELKSYGANINVMPKEASLLGELYDIGEVDQETGSYLKEEEMPNIKTIFWAYNIVDYAPYLTTKVSVLQNDTSVRLQGTWFEHTFKVKSGSEVTTGMKRLKNWWKVEGEWLKDTDQDQVMVGSEIAQKLKIKLGDGIKLKGKAKEQEFKVKGIFTSGDQDDDAIFTPLRTAQELADLRGDVSRVEVSALTTPDNDLARKAAKNPKSLTVKEWEVWYCTAYVSAISYQLQEVLTDAVAKPIRQVAESEGAILDKVQLLMLLITALSMLGAAMGISNLITASVMERSPEIGLRKAIGSHNLPIVRSILTETAITSLLGALLGYGVGCIFTQIIGYSVFGSFISLSETAIPVVIVMVLLVVLLGSIPAIRYLLSLDPTDVLHGK